MRNLMLSTSEPVIREVIEKVAMIPRAAIEKVKKLKDFAFLHFTDRHFAEKALPRLDSKYLNVLLKFPLAMRYFSHCLLL